MTTTVPVVQFQLDEQRYAIPLSSVERVLRAADITPLPKAPDVVLGVLNLHGIVMPVVSIRQRFNLPGRPLRVNDHFVVAKTSRRSLICPVDVVLGVLQCSENRIVDSAAVAPQLEYVTGILRMEDGLTLLHDLDTFLSLDEEAVLHKAMKEYGAPSTPKDNKTESTQ